MEELKPNLKWRTSPRSIDILIDRLNCFHKVFYDELDGSPKDLYNKSIHNKYYKKGISKPKNIHPNRRKLVYEIVKHELINGTGGILKDSKHKFVDEESEKQFINGYQIPGDPGDKESLARQLVTTAEQFGLMNSNYELTQMGLKACNDGFTGDDLICQLLKMYVVTNKGESGVFPFETFIKLILHYGHLSMNEMTFIFGVIHRNEIPKAIKAVGEFRSCYHNRKIIPNRFNKKKIRTLIIDIWNKYFPHLNNYYSLKGKARKSAQRKFRSINRDYPDAFKNALVYTKLFVVNSSGYGNYKCITCMKYKLPMFKKISKFNFSKVLDKLGLKNPSVSNQAWFGSINNKEPWLNKRTIKNSLVHGCHYAKENEILPSEKLAPYKRISRNKSISTEKLRESFNNLSDLIANSYITKFSKEAPKNKGIHSIITKRYKIIAKGKDIDGLSPALWLENNTWKALYSIGSSRNDLKIKYYGKTSPDKKLEPESFARGHYPDMKVHYDSSTLIVEVSLMTSVQQWEHEGSSVITHIDNDMKKDPSKNIKGIFLVKEVNFRSWWQFFVLNKNSWLGKPIYVAPITINEFIKILNFIYKNNLDIYKFGDLISDIVTNAYKVSNYKQWENNISGIISNWEAYCA